MADIITLMPGGLALNDATKIATAKDVFDLKTLFDTEKGHAAWAASAAVLSGEVRYQTVGGVTCELRSTTARTTTAAFDATEAAFWTLVAQSTVLAWAATTLYMLNFCVAHQGVKLRRSAAAGVSAATFSALEFANWTQVTESAAKAWAASTFVFADELRTHTLLGVGVLMRSATARPTNATYDAAEATQWTLQDQASPAAAFVASTVVLGGQRIRVDGNTWRRNATGTTGANFNADVANWTIEDRPEFPLWTAATYYPAGVAVNVASILSASVQFRRNTAGLSGAAFDLTEAAAANWSYAGQQSYCVWAAGVLAPDNVEIRQDGAIYRRTTTGTTLATFALDVGNWTKISDAPDGAVALAIAGNTPVALGEMKTYGVTGSAILELRSLSARTTGNLFTTEAQKAAELVLTNWQIIGQSDIPTAYVAAGTAVLNGMIFSIGGTIYKRTAETAVAGASFSADIAGYTALTSNNEAWGTEQTADFTAAVNTAYPISLISGNKTVTLPAMASLTNGNWFKFGDSRSAALPTTNQLNIGTASHNFNGVPGPYIMTQVAGTVVLTFVDTTIGFMAERC